MEAKKTPIKNLVQRREHTSIGLNIGFIIIISILWALFNLKIKFSKSVEIYRPHYLTYASLNNKLTERYNITSHYEYDEKVFKELLKHMEIKDRLMGTDFKKTCPEFFEDE